AVIDPALESIHSRLIREDAIMRDIIDAIKGISATMPEAGKELGQIGDLLNGIIMESNHSTGVNLDFEAPTNEAKNILE
ncbi:MAG: hypothetical protein P8Y70_16765, partial [Candidatus Lokiarchaeota archaeon]